MAIDSFLNEYRDYMYTKNVLLDSINLAKSDADIYVVVKHCIKILKELQNSMLYLDKNLIDVEKEIESIFNNVYKKIDKIEDIAEGYQNLNTNELSSDNIKSFNSFYIQDKNLYDEYYQGLALARKNRIKSLTTNIIERNNINGKETYKGFIDRDTFFIKVKIKDPLQTILKKVEIYSKNFELIEEIFDKTFIKIPKDAYQVVVYTDNVDSTITNYSQLDILNDTFSERATISLKEETFLNEGKLFKLNINFSLPTESYVTLKLLFKYKNKITNKSEQVIVYTSINNSKEVIVSKNEAKPDSKLKDIYKNDINVQNINSTDLVFSPEYSTNESIVKYLGNKVFDISNINSKDFTVNITVDLYSLVDKNKTPIIKGLFGYVTE